MVSKGKVICVIGVALCISVCRVVLATVWYVDASVEESGDGKTRETAFKKVQEGIDAASEGDTVIVSQGTYYENIHFKGKNTTLTGTDALDRRVMEKTVIDGGQAGCVVTFSGSEDESCVLSGFTIRNGWLEEGSGGGICGGTEDRHTYATIENNIISGNRAERGGGVTWCDGLIQGNIVTGNSASVCGAGLTWCDGTIQGNVIFDNISDYKGGGISWCNGTIQDNIIAGNSSEWSGGGLRRCHGIIRNNIVSGNTSRWGGGMHVCDATIENNLITDNWAALEGGGLELCDGTIRGNTITRNTADLRGGGLRWCEGTISNNIISENMSTYGGGLYLCGGTIENNTITGNWASKVGGGLQLCNGTIRNNIISGNTSVWSGGGLHRCGGTIVNNKITGNSSSVSYGGGLYDCDGVVQGNVVVGNMAGIEGGGLYGCDGTVVNNTIADNWAQGEGGGVAYCGGSIRNCIIWGNTAIGETQLLNSSTPAYSCIQGWSGGGNNIGTDPSFRKRGYRDDRGTPSDPWDDVWVGGDYRLPGDSPCVDAGDNSATDPPGMDLDGNLRIAFGRSSLTVDIGAYEYRSRRFAVSGVVLDGGLQLTWNSQPNDTYAVWSRADMLYAGWVREAIVTSGGEFTTWTDPDISSMCKFYWIEIE
jgi:hypothetical protein